MNETYTRVLHLPWDEVILAVVETQELEAEDGQGALKGLLEALLTRQGGG